MKRPRCQRTGRQRAHLPFRQRLRVEFKGSAFKVSFNGKHLFDAEDMTIKDTGKVGVWTKADSVTMFDDFSYGAE